jgi:hypothetical protein
VAARAFLFGHLQVAIAQVAIIIHIESTGKPALIPDFMPVYQESVLLQPVRWQVIYGKQYAVLDLVTAKTIGPVLPVIPLVGSDHCRSADNI